MRRETILTILLILSAVWFFLLANGELPTGTVVWNPCANEGTKLKRMCSSDTSDECTLAKEKYWLCATAQKQEPVLPPKKLPQNCELKETGKKRCDNDPIVGLGIGYDKVLKELRDSKNSECTTKWVLDKYCEAGTTCKGSSCVGVSCVANRNCIQYNGKGCKDGTCVFYCEDSDEKEKYTEFKKGRTISLVGKKKVEEDFCFNDKMLIEWFCDPTYDTNRPGVKFINYEKVRCEHSCSEGACKA
ncbi:MAG: hypothetical protein Q7R76_04780 [Candidatus Woesearchaeota archaeon]|nr:hypothetical protein [Candidatus Woesearchaeota archaeon]